MTPPLRLRLDLGYDGTDFSGWAEQPGRRTVAGALRAALGIVLRTEVRLVVAGRTDAGVHATGQVAHVDVDPVALTELAPRISAPLADVLAAGCSGLANRLAGLLPPDVRVRAVAPAPAGFDARFSALRRHYRYRIATERTGADPLRRRDTYALRRPLDLAQMRAAAITLLGTHDFAAYCRAPSRPDTTTIRELQALNIAQLDEPHVVAVEVSADAFCHSMVRSLVGVLIDVGLGRTAAARPGELLAARTRTSAIRTAPAHGLILVAVDYPPDGELADRADRTRAIRVSD